MHSPVPHIDEAALKGRLDGGGEAPKRPKDACFVRQSTQVQAYLQAPEGNQRAVLPAIDSLGRPISCSQTMQRIGRVVSCLAQV